MDNVNGDIIIYQTGDGLTKIDVKIQNETVWLSQQQMAELFNTSRTNIIEHINNIYLEEELEMILSSTGEKLLIGAGSIRHNQAIKKAKSEYKKYQVKTISPVEEEYLKVLKEINNKIEKQDKK